MARNYGTYGPAGSGTRSVPRGPRVPRGTNPAPPVAPRNGEDQKVERRPGRPTPNVTDWNESRNRPVRGDRTPPPGGASRPSRGTGASVSGSSTSTSSANRYRPPGSGATASSAPRVARDQKRTLAAAFPSKKKLSQYMEEAFADSKAAGKQKTGNWYKRAYAMWMKDVRATEQAKKGSSSRR